MAARGFILQPTYRIAGGRPVVHLWGRLEDGATFLVRDGRERPVFYVRADDRERAAALGARDVGPSERRTMEGNPLVEVRVATPPDTPPLRDRLEQSGIPTYEADVRFAMRYLIERGLRGSVEISGESRRGRGVDRLFDDPELAPTAAVAAPLRILSLDIETDPSGRRLLAVALSGAGAAEVLLLHPRDRRAPAPPSARPFADERSLLEALVERVTAIDPDLLTGWNVVDFDLRVLARLADSHGVPLALGRGGGTLRLRPSRSPWGQLEAMLPGRVVLDGPRLLRSSFVKMDDYSLETVSRAVLGEGKLIQGRDRATAILEAWRRDLPLFVDYNLRDTRLVLDILEKLRLVELAVERSHLTGLPVDRVGGSIAAFDSLYLGELHRRGRVGPTVRAASGASAGENLGGHVFEPRPGLYDHVVVYDFRSLYPSLIRTFEIDPLGFLPDPTADPDPIVAPNGAAFRREPGILPGLLDALVPRRQAAQKAGDAVASHAIKILMNSFYGVLGTPSCRFYRPEIAGAITAFGRELLLWAKERIEERGYAVLYGDTDSLFVLSGAGDGEEAGAIGRRLGAEVEAELARHVARRWRVESRLELRVDRLYRRLFLPAMRGGGGGARKRYAGLIGEGDAAEVVFTGMEVVRRDWTELAKRVQRELYARLFADRELASYLRDTVADLRAGRLDEHLVYRKALRKDLAAYTATTPPHVAAARKRESRAGRMVVYVMTTAGAEPLAERRHPLDYQHYVDRQVRPVAEPVLAVLGLDFAKVIGDDAQLELFA